MPVARRGIADVIPAPRSASSSAADPLRFVDPTPPQNGTAAHYEIVCGLSHGPNRR
jgi:hypothetical protein